jgi:N-acetylmuramoyl-L-alanine amidase
MDKKDIDVLARTIFGEARGEGVQGMAAVACVIRNRVRLDLHGDGRPDWWGEGYEGVCLKPWQFSCWNAGDPNRPLLERVTKMDSLFAQAWAVASLAVAGGYLVDVTNGATHYHAKTVFPDWAKGVKPCAEIGRHLFYRLV